METKTLIICFISIIFVLSTSNVYAEDNNVQPLKVPKPLTSPKEGTTIVRAKRGIEGLSSIDGITARGHPSGHG
uniref:Uncharacterized protein n=1 Tax=Panagrolaimus superbus TaxID=310955 RepID=A0A914XY62_9BILA